MLSFIVPDITAAPSALSLRTRRHELWFSRLFSGHVRRGRCSRDAGVSGKAGNSNELPYPCAGLFRCFLSGVSDAIAAQRKTTMPNGRLILDVEDSLQQAGRMRSLLDSTVDHPLYLHPFLMLYCGHLS